MKTITLAEADRLEWLGYAAAEIAKFRDSQSEHTQVWDMKKLHAARHTFAPIDTSDEGTFSGPWHVVRKYVTTEFRDWLESRGTRLTFTEWRAARIADRAQEATARQEYVDSAEYCTDQLGELRRLYERRDELIVTARERGASWAEIGEAIGLGRAQLHNIASKHRAKMSAAREEIEAGYPAAWIDDDEPF